MNKVNLQTTDMVDANIKRIGELFPSCLTEIKDENGRPQVAIDFDQLRQELSKDVVEGPIERYQFTWPDKRNSIRLANAPTTDTLRPIRNDETKPSGLDSEGEPYCSTGSVSFDTTQNLYIEGDNLQVLKLLREDYLGKIKVIYIDPPYNTGGDFVYSDNFSQSSKDYIHNSGQADEKGNRLVSNAESNGRFHTDWLNMIYPRLKVAKDLLSDDGVIFISIDDHEVRNMKYVCDEIFGESKLAGIVHRRKNRKPHNAGNTMSLSYEFILIYYRNKLFKLAQEFAQMQSDEKGEYAIYPVIKADKKIRTYTIKAGTYCEIDKINKGVYKAGRNANLNIEYLDSTSVVNNRTVSDVRLSARYCLTDEKGKLTEAMNNDNIFINSNGFPKEKRYRTEDDFKIDNHHWDIEKGKNEDGDEEIKELFDIKGINYLFQYPKPVALLQKVLSTIAEKDYITLDFFSGSASTAHAVMQLNAEDGGNRKFIMVQLPEVTEEKSEARKAGYKNICEIGKERIRRAGKKIKEEHPDAKDLDTGFRVLKLDSSNMEDVQLTPGKYTQASLFADNLKPNRTNEDLLFQTLLRLGIDLSANIKTFESHGKKVFDVNNNYLLACFDTEVNESAIEEIAKRQPIYFVMRDASLASDNVRDNIDQLWKHYNPGRDKDLIII